jgi:DNA-binding Lrp family transcriptional regulator
VNEILEILGGGWPMTQEAIAKAVNRPPVVVREELFRLIVKGHLARICGVGSMPALYSIQNQRQAHAPE